MDELVGVVLVGRHWVLSIVVVLLGPVALAGLCVGFAAECGETVVALLGGASWFLGPLCGLSYLSGWKGMDACLSIRHGTS